MSDNITNIRTLDNCVNRAVYRIFGIRDGENMACLRDSHHWKVWLKVAGWNV